MRCKSVFALVVTCAVVATAGAQQKLDQIRLGEEVAGKKPAPEALKGKVVLYELWGVNCPPCIATMPHVVRWNEEYSELGFVVVGIHSQNVEVSEVKAMSQRLGMRFPVVQSSNAAGDGTIPYSLLFDHTGRNVYAGKPAGVEEKLRPAIAAAFMADVSDPPKPIATVADTFKKGGSAIDALKKLNTLKNDSDKKVSEAAKSIVSKMTAVAQSRLDAAREEMETDPVAAYDAATFTAARWKGLPLGAVATDIVNKTKSNKVVVAELKARPTLETLAKIDAALSAAMKDDSEAQSAEFKKKHTSQIKQMTQAYQTITKASSDTPAAKSADVIAKKYDLKAK